MDEQQHHHHNDDDSTSNDMINNSHQKEELMMTSTTTLLPNNVNMNDDNNNDNNNINHNNHNNDNNIELDTTTTKTTTTASTTNQNHNNGNHDEYNDISHHNDAGDHHDDAGIHHDEDDTTILIDRRWRQRHKQHQLNNATINSNHILRRNDNNNINNNHMDNSPSNNNNNNNNNNEGYYYYNNKTCSLRGDGYGGGGGGGGGDDSNKIIYDDNDTNNNTNNMNIIQSHNYEPDENEVWRAHVSQMHYLNRGQWWTTNKKRSFQRWILTFIIGVIQAIIAITCNFISKVLSSYKFQHIYSILNQNQNNNNNNVYANNKYNDVSSKGDYVIDDSDDDTIDKTTTTTNNDNQDMSVSHQLDFKTICKAFIIFVLYQLIYVIIASIFVYIEPLSGGSGIPEVKCFLNGINIPRIARMKTLCCRIFGVIFSVASGLPIGMEGPMVHSGAVVAASISQGKTKLCHLFDISFSKLNNSFRNDIEKRDFIACGTASGVCSAFGSPIGGVLFALEETSSYFTIKLTWRAFFCAMTTLGTLFWVRNISSLWGQANIEKLFSLGEFNSLSNNNNEHSNFAIWELFIFMIIGCIGGLIGAVFNTMSEHITIFRNQYINYSKKYRFIEVIIISIIVSCCSFIIPLLYGKCINIPIDVNNNWSNQEKKLISSLISFQCISGKQYNDIASLYMTEADIAIKQLFHFHEDGNINSTSTMKTFSSGALFLFFIPYTILANITYGIAVPAGLFVPSLLSGAAMGRLIGHLLHLLYKDTFADSGTYALIGSAAMLGGTARMTISLTIILLEATGDMQYVLPLMVTVMAARFTGNAFNEGIYDISIKLKKIPFLEPDVPSIAERHEIVAGQVMSTEVKCLRPVEQVGVIYDLLRSYGHGNFPIVDISTGGTLYGTASRHILCTLLQRRAYSTLYNDNNTNNNQQHTNLGPRRLNPLVQWDTIERVYPRYPTIQQINIPSYIDRQCWLDLRPYANTAPYTINETASIQRTYRLFRTLGLRFLCVVNYHNQVVGIITRKDLMPDALTNSLLRGRNAHAVTIPPNTATY